ncbi:MAG: hypothetical protein OHK0029_40020 [Armatimonadaceae bacterium]
MVSLPSVRSARVTPAAPLISDDTVWETLRAVIEDISGELMLRPLLTRIVIHACNLIGADNGTIGLRDFERDLIRTEAAYRMPPSELGSEMPRGVGLAGEVLETGQPVVLNRYGEVHQPTQPELSENAVVGVPIMWRGDLIGVFGIGGSPQGRNEFFSHDLDLLTLFARHAAIAIVNAQRYEREQQARQETQLLFDTSARMSAASDMREVVVAYLQQVAAGDRWACSITEYVWDEADPDGADPRWVRVLGAWTPDTGLDLTPKNHPFVRDVLDDLLDLGETIGISDVHSDPRVNPTLREIQREAGRPALALIPLRGQGPYRLGHVILSAPHTHTWTGEELRRYEITARQLSTALEVRRQQQIAQHRQQLVAVLEERRRLARDLHDAVTQTLFSLHLIAQSVPSVLQRGQTEEAARRVERVVELSSGALAEMRALLRELKPVDDTPEEAPDAGRALLTRLHRDGLVATLTAFVTQTNDAQATLGGKRPRITFTPAPLHATLSPPQSEAFLRIAQEAIANAVKHSEARRILLALTMSEAGLRLQVHDDGSGFLISTVSEAAATTGGIGLSSMRERAEAIGADLTLTSQPGVGTQVSLLLPLKQNTAR